MFSNDTLVLLRARSAAPLVGGTVTLRADTGARIIGGSWQQLADSVVSSAQYPSGQIGTIVTISGQRLLCGSSNLSSVTLANTTVQAVLSANDTTIVVVAADGTPGQGDVVVTGTSGCYGTLVNGWISGVPGRVDLVSPPVGQWGTVVTINGTGLRGGGSNVVQVKFGTTVATLISETDTAVVVVVNSSVAVGLVNVVLRANTGATVTRVNGFSYLTASQISAVQPAFGQVGTRVVIRGSNLLGGGSNITAVFLGDSPAVIQYANDTEIHVVATAGAAQLVDVVVVSDTGARTLRSTGFRYVQLGVVSALYPIQGRTGTFVTICGSDLLGGGTSYQSITFGSRSTQIVATNATCVRVRL